MDEEIVSTVDLIVAEKKPLRTILREINNPDMEKFLKNSIIVVSADTYDEILWELHEHLDCETMPAGKRRSFSSIFYRVRELSILTSALYDAMNSSDYEIGLHFSKEFESSIKLAFVIDDYYPTNPGEYLRDNERIVRWQIYEHEKMDSNKLPKVTIRTLYNIRKDVTTGTLSFDFWN